MNAENYASLEASRRLVEAGIVLETDFYWTEQSVKSGKIVKNCFSPSGYIEEYVRKYVVVYKPNGIVGENIWPAPSMAEVWRGLPETFKDYELYIEKLSDKTMAGYWNNKGIALVMKKSNNPTDALIDLLIWVRKKSKCTLVDMPLSRRMEIEEEGWKEADHE